MRSPRGYSWAGANYTPDADTQKPRERGFRTTAYSNYAVFFGAAFLTAAFLAGAFAAGLAAEVAFTADFAFGECGRELPWLFA